MLYVAAPPLLPILALIILPLILPLYWKKVLISTAIFALLAMSWEFLVSVGMVSLGQALFFGAGAYAAGALGHYFDMPTWLTIPLATLLGGALCTILLLPVLRLRGIYFAMVTLVLPMMFERVIEATKIFGGTEGLHGLKPFPNQWVEVYLLLFVMGVALFAFRGIAQDERTALSLGINSDRIAGISVAFGSALIALAAILVLPRGTISVNEGYDVLVNAMAVCIIGGLGSSVGVVVASFLIGYAQMITDTLSGPHWKMIVSLIAILVILLIKPSGLFGKQKELEERI